MLGAWDWWWVGGLVRCGLSELDFTLTSDLLELRCVLSLCWVLEARDEEGDLAKFYTTVRVLLPALY